MKNKNYIIKFDPPKITSEEINKHKDFDALLEAYYNSEQPPKPNKFKKIIFWGVAVAAAVALLLIYFYTTTESVTPDRSQQYFANQPYINPPFGHIKEPFMVKTISAEDGGIYEFETGSKLAFPPNAFVDANGNPIAGKVDVKYREFHDFVDFFLAGIPMGYDSAGVSYNLESAGMIEIYAEKAGQEVFLGPNKKVEIELISELALTGMNTQPDYNIYKLDIENRNWIYKAEDDIHYMEPENEEIGLLNTNPEQYLQQQLEEKLQQAEMIQQNQLAKIEAQIPIPLPPRKPTKANGTDLVFDFDIEGQSDEELRRLFPEQSIINNTEKELTELRERYESTLWQFSPQNEGIDEKKIASVTWDDMKLRWLDGRDYELTLFNKKESVKIIVNPVLSGGEYEAAIEEYNDAFASYQKEIQAREEQLATEKENLRRKIERDKQAAQQAYQEKLTLYREKGLDYLATNEMIKQKVVNKFRATSFGIWNCDKPAPPYIAKLKGSFIDQNKAKLQHQTAFIVDNSRNTVSKFYAHDGCEVQFSKNADNLLWMVTEDNKLAVYRPEDFKSIQRQPTEEHTFVMNVIDREIRSEEDVREVLYF